MRLTVASNEIVMTDYLNDKTIVKNYSAADAAVKAIQAGADLLLEPDDLEAAYEGVLKAVKKGDITEDRLDESIYRILRVKLSMQDESSDTTESESVSDY